MKKITLYDTFADKDFSSWITHDVSYPEHLHYGAEFVVCLDGEIEVSRESDRYILHPGEGLFFMPYEMHSYKTSDTSKVAITVFSPELIDEMGGGDRYTNYKFCIPGSLIDFMMGIIDLKKWSYVQIKSLIYPLFCSFLNYNKITVSKNEYSDIVRQGLSYIEQHYHEEIGLSDASRAIGCHYVYLSRSFSENTGFSFSTYLNRYRIARSLHLLRNTQESITDIAYKCGFGSLRSYNRVFKSCMNQSPREYRLSDHPIY